MTYKYFEHEADIGIIGLGKTIEESFEEGAKAMFNVMVDISKVEPKEKVDIRCSAENDEELFVEWLNAALAEADMKEMVFSEFKIEHMKGGIIKGWAKGEKLDHKKHNVKVEVKAATYSMLEVGKTDGQFISKCVVDV